MPDARRELLQAKAQAERLLETVCRALAALGEPEPAEEEADPLPALMEECALRGIMVVDGRFVRERHAADLMGISRFTLRNRRKMGDPIIPFIKIDDVSHYDIRDIWADRKSVR